MLCLLNSMVAAKNTKYLLKIHKEQIYSNVFPIMFSRFLYLGLYNCMILKIIYISENLSIQA